MELISFHIQFFKTYHKKLCKMHVNILWIVYCGRWDIQLTHSEHKSKETCKVIQTKFNPVVYINFRDEKRTPRSCSLPLLTLQTAAWTLVSAPVLWRCRSVSTPQIQLDSNEEVLLSCHTSFWCCIPLQLTSLTNTERNVSVGSLDLTSLQRLHKFLSTSE